MRPTIILLLLASTCWAESKDPSHRAEEQAFKEAYKAANANWRPPAAKSEKPLDLSPVPLPKPFPVLSWEQYVKLHKTNPQKCKAYIEKAKAEMQRMDDAYDAMSPELKSPSRLHTVCTPSRTQIIRGKVVPEGLTHYDLLRNMVNKEWHDQYGLWNDLKPQLYDQGYQNLEKQYKIRNGVTP